MALDTAVETDHRRRTTNTCVIERVLQFPATLPCVTIPNGTPNDIDSESRSTGRSMMDLIRGGLIILFPGAASQTTLHPREFR